MKFENGPCVGKVGRQVDCDGAAVQGSVCERHGGLLIRCGVLTVEFVCVAFTLLVLVFLCWWLISFEVLVIQATIRHHRIGYLMF